MHDVSRISTSHDRIRLIMKNYFSMTCHDKSNFWKIGHDPSPKSQFELVWPTPISRHYGSVRIRSNFLHTRTLCHPREQPWLFRQSLVGLWAIQSSSHVQKNMSSMARLQNGVFSSRDRYLSRKINSLNIGPGAPLRGTFLWLHNDHQWFIATGFTVVHLSSLVGLDKKIS